MAILQVRDIDDRIYENLKKISQQNKRSISQEVIHIIETYLSNPQIIKKNSTEEFRNLPEAGRTIDQQKRLSQKQEKAARKTNGFRKNMAYLIDTDILIYSLKNDDHVKQKFIENQNIPKSISVITYGELVYGAKKSKHTEKNLAVTYRIADLFPQIEIDRSIMDIFGEIKSNLERKGKVIEDMDILIAATALSHNLILVTNNVKHFEKIKDLDIENWKE